MRSNAPLHARKKLPAGRASFEMVRGHDATRTRIRVTRGRETSAALGTGWSQGGEGNGTNSRDGTARYNNTYLRNQPAHVLVVDFLEHLAAVQLDGNGERVDVDRF